MTGASSNDTSPSVPSKHFPSKLSKLVSHLLELGFSHVHVEQAVLALQYKISLEAALDYLCLNLNVSELPRLFVDESKIEATGAIVEVVNNRKSTGFSLMEKDDIKGLMLRNDNHSHDVPTNLRQQYYENGTEVVFEGGDKFLCKGNSINQPEESEKTANKEKKKRWHLLKQYEYCESEEEKEEHIDDYHDKEYEWVPRDQEDLISETKNEQEHSLFQKEQELKEMEEDLKNDANNYIRSKQENRDLQTIVRKLRQEVKIMKMRLEKEKEMIDEQQYSQQEKIVVDYPLSQKDNVEEEEEFNRFFDLFGELKQQRPDSITMTTPIPTLQCNKLLDYKIPKGWTGTTPEKKLFELCQKRKILKPKYSKLLRNEGYRLLVHLQKSNQAVTWEAKITDFHSGSSLKDYLALHALYAIDSSLPLYLIFPPPFRDLWLFWTSQDKDEKDRAQKSKEEAHQQEINRLIDLISNLQCNHIITCNAAPLKQSSEFEAVLECLQESEVLDKSGYPQKSKLGEIIRRTFLKRKGTLSYKIMERTRKNLPISSFRQEILNTVCANPVTILCAETGAGKTTQCPQYILEQAILEGWGDQIQIICTQPRRVAATSVAERVAREMCDTLGNIVGYQIRMEAKRSSNTRLLFCTTGVLLRRLQDDSTLSGITHILVDEVHERQQQIDVLLIMLRQLLQTNRPNLKVVLMSATMDSELFCSFFYNSPLINVPGRTYPVINYFLEDLIEATGHVIDEGMQYAKKESSVGEQVCLCVIKQGGEKRRKVVDLSCYDHQEEVSSMYSNYNISTQRFMKRVNEEIINFDLIEDVLTLLLVRGNIDNPFKIPDGADISSGSILIFLPGIGEITAMSDRLESNKDFGDSSRFEIIPIHSALSSRDQRRAFLPTESRKIILSTNIAETSVTIPDVVCVIDSGRVREVRQNKRTLTSVLVTDWCSKSSARQRAGRAGRVQCGLCLKLYSSYTAETVMKQESLPELQRVPLEEICLSILACGFTKSCVDFLSQAPQPPSHESVNVAISVLQEVGALERPMNNQVLNDQAEQLTPLGLHLAKLPVDVRLGKMLIYASLFKCIYPVLTITAALSSQSPFSAFIHDAAVAKAKQRAFVDADSDFMTYCNVWDAYRKNSMTASAEMNFCQDNYLNSTSLREITHTREYFFDLLCRLGFLDRNVVLDADEKMDLEKLKVSAYNSQSNKKHIINSIIFAGLYPNVARLDCVDQKYNMFYKDERLHFHNSSVNALRKIKPGIGNWVVFYEKFGTPKRTSVATTCFVHPPALILFGGDVVVKHCERLVVVSDWIHVKMAAQTSVSLKEKKKEMGILLQKMIEGANLNEIEEYSTSFEEIIEILTVSS